MIVDSTDGDETLATFDFTDYTAVRTSFSSVGFAVAPDSAQSRGAGLDVIVEAAADSV